MLIQCHKGRICYLTIIVAVTALTGGSAFLMWMGENITVKGVGNGISIILLINIVARMPSDVQHFIQPVCKDSKFSWW